MPARQSHCAVVWWAFDIATLWAAFHAFGGDVPPWPVIMMSYFVGMIANTLPIPQSTLSLPSTSSSVRIAGPPLPFSAPQLTVALEPVATYGPRPGDAVAQATVTCDVSTPVRVVGSITQGGLTATHTYASGTDPAQWCHPDAPLLAFVPAVDVSGTGTFGPGPATVSVEVYALFGPGDEPATDAAPLDLVDQVALASSIGELLQDPAATGLRATILRAIVTRFWQDPVFRTYWISLFAS